MTLQRVVRNRSNKGLLAQFLRRALVSSPRYTLEGRGPGGLKPGSAMILNPIPLFEAG